VVLSIPAAFAIASATLGCGIALLVYRISREPGWRDQRQFAMVALTAGLATIANLNASLPMDDGTALVLARAQFFFLSLHVAAWHRYAGTILGSGLPSRAAVVAACFVGLVALVPGALYRPELSTRQVGWLGFTYRDTTPTPLGGFALAALLGLGLYLTARFLAAWRRGRLSAALPGAGLLATLAMGTNDTLVMGGVLDMPYVLDFGFLVPLAAVAYGLIGRFADDARALSELRGHLEKEVAARTRELEEARESLHQAQKLGALGHFAAGVAHEVNNPAAVVSANLTYLTDFLSRSRLKLVDVRECLEESTAAMARIGNIVRQLLDASRVAARSARSSARPVRLRAVAQEAGRMARARAGDRAEVLVEVPPDLLALGDEQLLVQVVGNLVVNAAQAIPAERRGGRVRVRGDRAAGGVRLLVEDNGTGMSPETMQRLFEPFFTTKPAGSGTGLGLAVSRGFVMSMGGSLRFESELGRGTTAVLFLREAAGEPEPEAAPAATTAPGSERLSLLIVDDEPHALSSLRRLLSSRYDVTVAATVPEALERAGKAPFDLVLCDVIMPDGGGEAIYRGLLRDRPQLASRLIFLSGGVARPETARFLEEQPQPLLHKPLDVEALAEAGRRLLAAPE